MAFTPPAPGSIASRPTIKKGGVRGADESPEDFSQRMATRQASPVQASPGATPTRRDNILTARADGSFDAKRNAFNAGTAQHGRSMDEAGNITGATAAFAAPRPASQLVPGRSAGSMVMPPAAPAPAAAPSPAPQIPNTPAAPAPAPPPGGIRPPAQTAAPAPAPAAPMGPTSTATASAGKMSLTPQPAPAPASRMSQRQQRTQSPTAAPAPPSPAVPPGTGPMRPPATGQTNALMGRLNQSMAPPPASQGAGPAKSAPVPAAITPAPGMAPPAPAASVATPAAQPPARKPGMINDGQGWKPASEVNASLRAAQDARATVAATPAPLKSQSAASATPSPAPGVLNQAAVDAHWTPERVAASRKEESRLRSQQQAKEDAGRLASVTPKPKAKTDAEYAKEGKWNAQWADIESNQKVREATEKANRGKPSGPGPGMHTDYDVDPKTGQLIEKTVHSKTGVVIQQKRTTPQKTGFSKPPAFLVGS